MLSIVSTTLLYRRNTSAILSIYATYVASHLLAVRERERERDRAAVYMQGIVFLSKIPTPSITSNARAC